MSTLPQPIDGFRPMLDLEGEKALAAARAIEEVEDGMLVGLGTGSTASYAVRFLAERMGKGLEFTGVATSQATESLARGLGIALVPFDGISRVDLTIDGADEVDPRLRAIKGGGGALLREKLVASASDRVIIIVDSSKPVERLGRFRLPVEALPFGRAYVQSVLASLGAPVTLRVKADGTPFMTDQGGNILDLDFGTIDDPEKLAAALDAVVGVVEHGLFLKEVDTVVIARGKTLDIINRGEE